MLQAKEASTVKRGTYTAQELLQQLEEIVRHSPTAEVFFVGKDGNTFAVRGVRRAKGSGALRGAVHLRQTEEFLKLSD